jgi:GT2 family glycosyltransferase
VLRKSLVSCVSSVSIICDKEIAAEVPVEVTVVIPVRDEFDPYLEQCLESLKRQNYHDPFEVIVVMGGNRAQARNVGIVQSRGEIIAFIDSDCVATPEWLSLLVENLKKDKDVGGVGGVNSSPENGPKLGRAVDYVFSSYIGSLGSASLHNPSRSKFVESLACINSAYWKDILFKIGGFDEEFELCEDTNLSHKVRRQGYRLLLVPIIKVQHYRRDTVKRFASQFFSYGVGRVRSILTRRDYATIGVVIPFSCVLVFPFVLWYSPIAALSMFIVYVAVLFLKGFQSAYNARNLRLSIVVPGLFLIEHFSFLLGFFAGFPRGRWKKPVGSSKILYRMLMLRDATQPGFVSAQVNSGLGASL